MKTSRSLFAALLLTACAALSAAASSGSVNWVSGFIEAEGQAVVPAAKAGTPAGQLLAKRGAMVDLQRAMLEIIQGVQVDGRTVMKDFEASDRVRTEVRGMVKGIEITDASFAEGIYTVTGRVPITSVRRLVAPELPKKKPARAPQTPRKAPSSLGAVTGVVIDARSVPLVPATTFRIVSQSGRTVYSYEQVNYERFLQAGMCEYHNNIQYAKGQTMLGRNFVTIRPVGLQNGRVDIVISDSDADRLAGTQPFKTTCSVAVVIRD